MDIIELSNDVTNQYVQLITDEVIINILDKRPTLWFDIQQRIRKYIYDSEDQKDWDKNKQKWAQTKLIESIISAFLIPEQNTNTSHYTSGKDLKKSILHGIIQNKKLFAYIKAKTPPSFIEYPTHKLTKLETSGQVLNLLNRIIRRNTGKTGREYIEFNKIFNEIIDNIKSIFGIDIRSSIPGFDGIKEFTSLNAPADLIHKWLTSKKWRTPADAALLLRAFYAWWGINSIKEAQKNAKQAQKELFSTFDRLGCVDIAPLSEDSSREQQRTIKFNVPLSNGTHVPVIIDSGIKSIRSILIKLYADEKYNNIDAVNDLLWARDILEEVPLKHRAECIAWFSRFMGDSAFIFKNKRLVDDTRPLEDFWQNTNENKEPVLVSSEVKLRSSDEYKDCKYSGYISANLSKKPVGIEIQFFENKEDPSPKGEAHHTILNAQKVIQGWVRSEHMITGKQILAVINKECIDENTGYSPSELSIQEIFWTLMKKLLTPYTLWDSENTKMVIFWIRDYENLLKEDYPSAHKITVHTDIPVSDHSGKLTKYINSILH